MEDIKFITSLNDYVDNRSNKIQAKKEEVHNLYLQLNAKNEEIKLLKEEYKVNFDEEVYKKILSLKSEADKLENDEKQGTKIIHLMDEKGCFQYDNDTLNKEIETVISDSDLPTLKDNIKNAKAEYLRSLDVYTAKVREVATVRDKLESLGTTISDENKETIYKAFNNAKNLFYFDFDDLTINNRNEVDPKAHRSHSVGVAMTRQFERKV